ncbi:hypothetical protein J7394_21165, partial [Ruegeria sp. R13_0]|uniref:PA14 domain-containing protein n=1 Tax=Ruegeria sp. R13_0 TaxID=2821099 RepID=UPI001B1963C3
MGLFAQYFVVDSGVSNLSQIDFEAIPSDTGMVSELDTELSLGSLWADGPSDYFAARYTGQLNVEAGGTYTLYLTSDDGSALYIDGQRVINNDGLHSTRELAVTLNLAAGVHDIEVQYFDAAVHATLQLEWEGPDSNGIREVIGGDTFSHDNTGHGDHTDDSTGGDESGHGAGMQGLYGSYFVLGAGVSSLSEIDFDATPYGTGTASELNTYRSNGSLWDGGPSDNFAARYAGNLNVAQGGVYTLYLTSDDGSALYIDGQPVIDNDGLHGARELAVTLDLSEGAHAIEILYFEAQGRSTLQLEWEGPDSNGAREVISGDAFSHGEHTDDSTGGDDTGHGDHTDDSTGGDDTGQGDHTDDSTGGDDTGHGDHTDDSTGGDDSGHGAGMQGLYGSYFVLGAGVSSLSEIDFDATPYGTGTASQLNTFRSNSSLWDGGPSDNFAARYTGNLNVAQGGVYTFYLTSDDGSALYIDGQPVIDNDGLHWFEEQSVTLDLSEGAHEIEVLYFEQGGEATLQLEWEGPDSNGAREVISGDAFSHGEHTDDSTGGDDTGHGDHTDDSTGGDDTGQGDHTDDSTGGDDTGHGDHTDHSAGYIPPPTDASEVEAYVAAVKALPDAHAHGDDPSKAGEH